MPRECDSYHVLAAKCQKQAKDFKILLSHSQVENAPKLVHGELKTEPFIRSFQDPDKNCP